MIDHVKYHSDQFVKRGLVCLGGEKPFCLIDTRKYIKLHAICLSVMIIILLCGCNPPTYDVSSQSNGNATPIHNQSSLSNAPEQINIAMIKRWKFYDINTLDWSSDATMWSVGGSETYNSAYGVFAFGLRNLEKLWFQETYIPISLDYQIDDKGIAIPFYAGLTLLNPTTGEVLQEVLYQESICFGDQEIKFLPDGMKLLTLSTNTDAGLTSIYIWDFARGNCLGKFLEEKGVAFDLDTTTDGRSLVLGLRDIRIGNSYEQQVQVWNIEQQQKVCSFNSASPIALSPDGNFIAAANTFRKGKVGLWNAKTCQFVGEVPKTQEKSIYSMDFSPDGKMLAIGGNDFFQVWEVTNKKLLYESDKLPNHVSILAFSPDGRYLLSETERLTVDDNAIITLWGITQ